MYPLRRERGHGAPEDLFLRYRSSGDERAFAALYDAFEQRMFATAVRFFRSRQQGDEVAYAMASDAAQETWIRVIQKREQWDPARGAFASWLWGIHVHVLMDACRRSPTPEGRAAAPDDERGRRSTRDDLDRRLLALEALEIASEELSRDDAALLLSYYLVADARWVSHYFDLSEPALRKRIERLKNELRARPRFSQFLDALAIGRAAPGGPAT